MALKTELDKDGLYLALGGGAARGLAHLGVLKALQEHEIPIAGICGTSMGALIGASYALAPDADHVISDFVEYIHSTHYTRARYAFMRAAQKQQKESRRTNFMKKLEHGLLLGRSLTTGAIISFENYRSEVNSLIPNKTFKNTAIPFYAVAVDLIREKEVVFNQGLLRSAVLASAAIPGAFPSIKYGDNIYVDGGWMNKVPVKPLISLGAKKILAVDVFYKEPPEVNLRRGFSIVNQSNNATERRLLQLQMEEASIVWQPPVSDLHWAEFTQVEKAVEAGYQYASARIDEVRLLLEPKPGTKEKWWVSLARKMIPPEPQQPVRYPVEMRGIWDVTDAEV